MKSVRKVPNGDSASRTSVSVIMSKRLSGNNRGQGLIIKLLYDSVCSEK